MKPKIYIIIVITTLLVHVAAFEYKDSTPEVLYPQQTAVISYDNPGAITNPAYLPLQKNSYISLSAAKPYGLEELQTSTCKTGIHFNGHAYQFSWNNFGMKEYQENIFQFNSGYKLYNGLFFGSSLNYYNLKIQTELISFETNVYDLSIAALAIPFQWLHISLLQRNIYSLFDHDRKDLLFPELTAGIGLIPFKGSNVSWNISRSYFGYTNSISAGFNILQSFSIKGGYSFETTTYAAAISFSYRHILFSYGFKYHPYLGNTHTVGTTISLHTVEYANIKYSRRKINPRNKIKKIHLNKCSISELKSIPVLSEKHASRIIRYRKIIGSIGKKGLMQIGMKQKDINQLMIYSYGLKKPYKKKYKKRKKFTNYKLRRILHERKKQIFGKLLVIGVPAYYALKIAQYTIQKNKAAVTKTINSLSLNESQRQMVKTLCFKYL